MPSLHPRTTRAPDASPRSHRSALAALFGAAALTACASTPRAESLSAPELFVTAPDGSRHPIAELVHAHEATVLVWWASTCPCVRRYEARVKDLAERFSSPSLAFYHVASNADDGPEVLAAAARSAPLPILHDHGGRLADFLGVRSTPTVVVLDRSGRVRFEGWLDNERTPGAPGREAWLEDALTAFLVGADTTRRTPTYGCIITRSLGQVGRCHGGPPAPHHTATTPASTDPTSP